MVVVVVVNCCAIATAAVSPGVNNPGPKHRKLSHELSNVQQTTISTSRRITTHLIINLILNQTYATACRSVLIYTRLQVSSHFSVGLILVVGKTQSLEKSITVWGVI